VSTTISVFKAAIEKEPYIKIDVEKPRKELMRSFSSEFAAGSTG
jgi:hypothetical protein